MINIEHIKVFFPEELTQYFDIINIEVLGNVSLKEEFMVVYFQEKNQLPLGYSQEDYETKDFVESKLIQDFPIRGRAVYLMIKIRRWRNKQTGQIIKRPYHFASDSGKFTQELSDFLKEASGYATRYHQDRSELLRD